MFGAAIIAILQLFHEHEESELHDESPLVPNIITQSDH